MSAIYYDNDADLQYLADKKVAVIGYGSQGHAHALNLRDSGIEVIVGMRPQSVTGDQARRDGFLVTSVAEAAKRCQVIMVLVPDTEQAAVFDTKIRSGLEPGNTLLFAHGFNVRYGLLEIPAGVDVAMVAPKAPGHRVREVFTEGGGTPGLVAVAQDGTGNAKATALAYARAIGCTRAGVIETTFSEETETDLFGEQAVLCGGVSALVRCGFETLVEAGYQPEIAYFECLHELKLIVDLMYRGGLEEMWHSVSDTAEHGGYEGGDRIVTDEVRAAMRSILDDVRSGAYAVRWIEENGSGRKHFEARRAAEAAHPVEEVGRSLRQRMAFLPTQAAPAVVEEPAA